MIRSILGAYTTNIASGGSKRSLSCELGHDRELTRRRMVDDKATSQAGNGLCAGAVGGAGHRGVGAWGGGREGQQPQHEARDQVRNWLMQGQACSLVRNNSPWGHFWRNTGQILCTCVGVGRGVGVHTCVCAFK